RPTRRRAGRVWRRHAGRTGRRRSGDPAGRSLSRPDPPPYPVRIREFAPARDRAILARRFSQQCREVGLARFFLALDPENPLITAMKPTPETIEARLGELDPAIDFLTVEAFGHDG